MNENLILLITLNYSIIETLEKFGMKKIWTSIGNPGWNTSEFFDS